MAVGGLFWQFIKWILILLFPFLGMFAQNSTLTEAKQLEFQSYFFEALRQKSIGNYDKALVSLEQCQKIGLDKKAVLFEVSKNNLALKNFYEAEYAINEALKLDSENVFLLQHLVAVYKQQQHYGKAIAVQEKLAKKSPIYADELVQLYLYNGQSDKAMERIKSLEKTNALSPTLASVKKRMLAQLEPEKIEKEVVNVTSEVTLKAFKKNKDFGLLKQLLAQSLQANNFEKTIEASNVGLQYFPAQALIYVQKATALNKLQKYDDAIDTLDEGIDFVIEDTELLNRFYKEYITAYQATNQTKKATEFKRKIQ